MADPPLNLGNIPYDCQHEILRHLNAEAVKNLRLTSRQMKNVCSGPVFNKFLRRKTVDLSKKSLDSLIDLACYEEFRGVVRELNIRVPTFDCFCLEFLADVLGQAQNITDDDIKFIVHQQQIQYDFLDEGCYAYLLSALKTLRRLDRINVDLVVIMGVGMRVIDGRDWWQWEDETGESFGFYRLVMLAIAKSGISVNALAIYQGSTVFSVSLPCLAGLTAKLERHEFTIPASELKAFAIRVRPRIPSDVDFMVHNDGDDSPSNRDVLGFVRLLKHMKRLEELKLDVFTHELNKDCAVKVFPAVASRLHWPHLRRCTLAGIFTDEASLLKFLRDHSRLESLAIERLTLTTGPWDTVCKVLSEDMHLLTHLRLSRIQWNTTATILANDVNLLPRWEKKTHILAIQEYWEPSWARVWQKSIWVHTREFDADDLKRGLDFCPMPDDALPFEAPEKYFHDSGYCVVDYV